MSPDSTPNNLIYWEQAILEGLQLRVVDFLLGVGDASYSFTQKGSISPVLYLCSLTSANAVCSFNGPFDGPG